MLVFVLQRRHQRIHILDEQIDTGGIGDQGDDEIVVGLGDEVIGNPIVDGVEGDAALEEG